MSEKKIVLITGASSGIGEATLESFPKRDTSWSSALGEPTVSRPREGNRDVRRSHGPTALM